MFCLICCRRFLHNPCHRQVLTRSSAALTSLIHTSPSRSKSDGFRRSPQYKRLVIRQQLMEKTNRKLEYKRELQQSRPRVSVYQGMTVKELADTLDTDIENIFEMMLFVKNKDIDQYDTPNSEINDIGVISDIVKKCHSIPLLHVSPKQSRQKSTSDNSIKEIIDKLWSDHQFTPDIRVRPPVVSVMGHVDHGKTTLLDALRKTNVVDSEFGGITQHIGAFPVSLGSDLITFLDTPGHSAFSSMRSRVAMATDIVVLVVAGDDGVMEQTLESISYARLAKVPLVVAISKCDKPEADVERVKSELAAGGVVVEELGGDVPCVTVSGLKSQGLATLKETLLAEAEILDLKSDHSSPVAGVILESKQHPSRGKLATALIQQGALTCGKVIWAGNTWGKIRLMFDWSGKKIEDVGPGLPVEVTGWRDHLPSVGQHIMEMPNERAAKKVVMSYNRKAAEEKQEGEVLKIDEMREEMRKIYLERRNLGKRKKLTGKTEYLNKEDEGMPRVSVVIKGDVDGSIEAILDVLVTYDSTKCKLDIIHHAVGPVTESDVDLAATCQGVIYTFNTSSSPPDIIDKAKSLDIDIRSHQVIYQLVADLIRIITNKLPPIDEENVTGKSVVLQEFLIDKKIPVAGVLVDAGVMKRSSMFRVVRDGDVIHRDTCKSLKHLKQDVESLKKGIEGGIMLDDQAVRFQVDDVIECYYLEPVYQELDWKPPGF